LPVVEEIVLDPIMRPSPSLMNEPSSELAMLRLSLDREPGKLYTLPAKHFPKSRPENRNDTIDFFDKPVKQQSSRRGNKTFNPYTKFPLLPFATSAQTTRRVLPKDALNSSRRSNGTRFTAAEKFRGAIYTVVMLNRLLKTSRAVLVECYENSAARSTDSDIEKYQDRDYEDQIIATPLKEIEQQRWLDILQWGLNYSQKLTMRMLLGILPPTPLSPYLSTISHTLNGTQLMDKLADDSHFFNPLDNTETKVSAVFESIRSICAAEQGRFAHSESTLDGRLDGDEMFYTFRGRKMSLQHIESEQNEDFPHIESSASVERAGGLDGWMFDDSDARGKWAVGLLRSIVTTGNDDASFHKKEIGLVRRSPSPPGRMRVRKDVRSRSSHKASRTGFVSSKLP
jgi:hypothetical protein